MPHRSDVAIQAVVFHPDGGFDITYAEQDDIMPKGTILRQLMVPRGLKELPVDAVLDDIRELLDLALEARYDAPDHITRVTQN